MVEMMRSYRENKDLIHAYVKGETYEGLNGKDGVVMGMSVAMFVIYFLVTIGLWIWALTALIKFWSILPVWSKVLGIIGLLMPMWGIGSIVTLICVYIGKGSSYTLPGDSGGMNYKYGRKW